MQPADVNGHSLQDECGAFSDRLMPPLGELVEKVLVAVDGTGRAGGPEILLEKNGVTQRVILTPRRCRRGWQPNEAQLCRGMRSLGTFSGQARFGTTTSLSSKM